MSASSTNDAPKVAPTTTSGLAETVPGRDANGGAVANSAESDEDGGFEPSRVERLPLSELARRIGPGFILAGIQLGPGSLTTSAMIGADSYSQNLNIDATSEGERTHTGAV